MKLGVIADDFTGATDIAGFLVAGGLRTTQLIGVPTAGTRVDAEAVVISLKSRSNPAERAVADSLAALDWLRGQGCGRIFQKYCSTFDSTSAGNIGPVADALMAALGAGITVICQVRPPGPLIAISPSWSTVKSCAGSEAGGTVVRPDTVSDSVSAPTSPYRRKVIKLPCGTSSAPSSISLR